METACRSIPRFSMHSARLQNPSQGIRVPHSWQLIKGLKVRRFFLFVRLILLPLRSSTQPTQKQYRSGSTSSFGNVGYLPDLRQSPTRKKFSRISSTSAGVNAAVKANGIARGNESRSGGTLRSRHALERGCDAGIFNRRGKRRRCCQVFGHTNLLNVIFWSWCRSTWVYGRTPFPFKLAEFSVAFDSLARVQLHRRTRTTKKATGLHAPIVGGTRETEGLAYLKSITK